MKLACLFLRKPFSRSKKCFPTALRCSASSACAHPRRLIWTPPRSMTCGPSGPPSPCLLVCVGHHSGGGSPPDAPAGSSCGNVFSRSTSSTTVRSRMVSAYNGLTGGAQEVPSPAAQSRGDRPYQRSSPAAPATPAAALVEDEPSSSTAKRRKVHVDPIVRDWFLRRDGPVEGTTAMDHAAVLCEVRCLCPRMFDGINQNTPYRWKRSPPH